MTVAGARYLIGRVLAGAGTLLVVSVLVHLIPGSREQAE